MIVLPRKPLAVLIVDLKTVAAPGGAARGGGANAPKLYFAPHFASPPEKKLLVTESD